VAEAAVKWTAADITHAVQHQLLGRKCFLMVDNCYWTGDECDILGVTDDLRLIDIEVKISRADLKKDAEKDKWWQRPAWRAKMDGAQPVPREWPRRVWKHYYAMPEQIWKPELAEALPSPRSGILLLAVRQQTPTSVPAVYVRCERRATPNRDAEKISAANVMDIARLGNLRMWDAYRTVHTLENRVRQLMKAA
jgi:hypothetical protein